MIAPRLRSTWSRRTSLLLLQLVVQLQLLATSDALSSLRRGQKVAKDAFEMRRMGMGKSDAKDISSVSDSAPRFASPVSNVTVRAGQTAVLTCQVSNLGNYKVAWVRVDTQTILTIHTSIVTRNPRVSLSHHDDTVWRLHLDRARREDRGFYMCQLNTDPMMSVQGFVEVVVPPTIVDEMTSASDLLVKEKAAVNLTCNAVGHPQPKIRWRRADGAKLKHRGSRMVSVEGGSLFIASASRSDIGKYYCIATNGVPPSRSKSVNLRVQFAPMVWVANQQELSLVGERVSLVCSTEAWPKAIHYWMRDTGRPITSNTRYTVKEESNELATKTELVIHEVRPDDFGGYVCVAKNSLGVQDGHITVSERHLPPPTSTPQSSWSPSSLSSSLTSSTSMWVTRRPKSRPGVFYRPFTNGMDLSPTDKSNLAVTKRPDHSSSQIDVNSNPINMLVVILCTLLAI